MITFVRHVMYLIFGSIQRSTFDKIEITMNIFVNGHDLCNDTNIEDNIEMVCVACAHRHLFQNYFHIVQCHFNSSSKRFIPQCLGTKMKRSENNDQKLLIYAASKHVIYFGKITHARLCPYDS